MSKVDSIFPYKLFTYLGLWFMKIISFIIIQFALLRENISPFFCYFILFWQKLHLPVYMLLSCDLIFLYIRVVFHTETDSNLMSTLMAVGVLFLYLMDTIGYLWSLEILKGPNKYYLQKLARVRINQKIAMMREKMRQKQKEIHNNSIM